MGRLPIRMLRRISAPVHKHQTHAQNYEQGSCLDSENPRYDLRERHGITDLTLYVVRLESSRIHRHGPDLQLHWLEHESIGHTILGQPLKGYLRQHEIALVKRSHKDAPLQVKQPRLPLFPFRHLYRIHCP